MAEKARTTEDVRKSAAHGPGIRSFSKYRMRKHARQQRPFVPLDGYDYGFICRSMKPEDFVDYGNVD